MRDIYLPANMFLEILGAAAKSLEEVAYFGFEEVPVILGRASAQARLHELSIASVTFVRGGDIKYGISTPA